MSNDLVILSVGAVDERGVAGTSGVRASWAELGAPAPGTGRTYRALFGRADPTFRRLDRQARAIVLAAAASGVDQVLSADEREATALIAETACGSIEVDLRYTGSLQRGVVEAAIFPYTLQSTCLGDVALRHGLRGPTISLSIEPGQAGEALREARRVLATGGARFALACAVDALISDVPTLAPVLRCTVAVLGPKGARPAADIAWPDDDPFRALADRCFPS